LAMDDRFIGSGSIIVNDTPTGREVLRYPEPEIDEDELPVQLYDVVTIGGFTKTGAPGFVSTSINDFYREQNHIFLAGATAYQVNAGVWTWGGEDDYETHFALAAIPHGTRNLIPVFEGPWWNIMVPASILFARAWGENSNGEPITLRLTIGKIQPP
jgi:hypothetical protein